VIDASTNLMMPNRGLITVSLIVATIMLALDTTIANVALPHIQGSIAATQEQMSWVLTSYIVASAVMTPLTAWLSVRIGRKKLLLTSIVAFTAMSVLCGAAQSLFQIVLFRLLQGISGAAFVPVSQAILLDINPPERHARAMSMWVLGITIGPILGAPFGAWITDYTSWRWVFYINVPIGVFCFLSLRGSLVETSLHRRSFDFLGFATLSIATLCLQLMLDRGQMKDWFNSTEIWVEATCGALAAYLFLVHTTTTREPFINLHLFQDRNFATSCALAVVVGVLLIGPMALMTAFLQGLMQYPVMTAGLLLGTRGIGTLFAGAVMGHLLRFVDARLVIVTGFSLAAVALTQMCRFNLQMSYHLILWSGILFGLGISSASIAITSVTFSTLPARLRTDGAAMYNLVRTLGGSIGIAMMQTFFTRNAFAMQVRLAEYVTPYANHLRADLSNTAGLVAMNGRVAAQASMIAYNNTFKLMLVMTLVTIPFAILLRKPIVHKAVAPAAE